MVVIGQELLYLGKSGCYRANVIVSGQKWLYSGKSEFIRSKWLKSGKSVCFGAKVVVFEQSGCIR